LLIFETAPFFCKHRVLPLWQFSTLHFTVVLFEQTLSFVVE